MSEKRLRFTMESDKLYSCIFDNGNELTCFELVDLLNEQQATISTMTEENKELGKNFEDLVDWASKIAKRNVVLDEQIGQLQRENEQLRAINKKIGDDLYNCRLNKNIIREKLKLWQDVHKEYDIYSIKDFEELMKNDK